MPKNKYKECQNVSVNFDESSPDVPRCVHIRLSEHVSYQMTRLTSRVHFYLKTSHLLFSPSGYTTLWGWLNWHIYSCTVKQSCNHHHYERQTRPQYLCWVARIHGASSWSVRNDADSRGRRTDPLLCTAPSTLTSSLCSYTYWSHCPPLRSIATRSHPVRPWHEVELHQIM